MIVQFTDFGLHGPYVGQMKAVLDQMVPGIATGVPPYLVDALGELFAARRQGQRVTRLADDRRSV